MTDFNSPRLNDDYYRSFYKAKASVNPAPHTPEVKADAPATQVGKSLVELSQLFEEKNAQYGDAYKRFGAIMQVMYPEGRTFNNVNEWNQLGCLFNIVANLNRHATNKQSTPAEHVKASENLDDLAVYTMMLEELVMSREGR